MQYFSKLAARSEKHLQKRKDLAKKVLSIRRSDADKGFQELGKHYKQDTKEIALNAKRQNRGQTPEERAYIKKVHADPLYSDATRNAEKARKAAERLKVLNERTRKPKASPGNKKVQTGSTQNNNNNNIPYSGETKKKPKQPEYKKTNRTSTVAKTVKNGLFYAQGKLRKGRVAGAALGTAALLGGAAYLDTKYNN